MPPDPHDPPAEADPPRDSILDQLGGTVALDDDPLGEARDNIRARLFGGPEASRTIGRYRLEGRLGSGGMGVVYTAFDPDLQRRVAVKVLRPSAALSPDRLDQEARALAKLDHPNVVSVLELGEHEGSRYVAMELVEGDTLAAWIAEQRPDAASIIDAYRQAGAGLAAAHERGLVHRYFKPHNAMIDAGGRVRVLDFGLARDVASTVVSDTGEPPAAAGRADSGPDTAIAGTPAYMAPEQLDGGTVDAAADQFALCVALWEGLCGVRPFTGTDRARLRENMRGPPPAFRPLAGRVSPRVRDALRRGLSENPRERWASVAELCDQWAPRSTARRGVLVGTLFGGVVATALAVAAWPTKGPTGSACAAGSQRVAEVWSSALRGQIEAVQSTGAPSVRVVVAALQPELGVAFSGWATAWDAACPDEAKIAEHLCLDETLARLGNVATTLAEAEPTVATQFEQLWMEIHPYDACDDPDVQALFPPPPTPTRHVAVREIRGELARTRAFAARARTSDALAVADPLLARAEAVGDEAVTAEVRLERARLLARLGEEPRAADEVERAALEAEASHNDRIVAMARIERVWIAWKQRDAAAAEEHLERADAAVRRLGSPRGLAARLEFARARVALARRDRAGLMEATRRGIDLLRSRFGDDDLRTVFAHSQLVVAAFHAGEMEVALGAVDRILAAVEPRLDGIAVALHQTLDWQARILEAMGRDEDLAAVTRRNIAALRDAGLENLSVARGHARLAGVAERAGDTAGAEREAALAEGLFAMLGEDNDPVLGALRRRMAGSAAAGQP